MKVVRVKMEAKKGKPVYAERTSYARAARGVHEARPVPACSRVRYAPIFCRRRHWSGKAYPNASSAHCYLLLNASFDLGSRRVASPQMESDVPRALEMPTISSNDPSRKFVNAHGTGFGDCSHSTWGECQVLESEVKSLNHVTCELIFSLLRFCTLSDSGPK